VSTRRPSHLVVALPQPERREDRKANCYGSRQSVPGGEQPGDVSDAVEDQADEARSGRLFAVSALAPDRRELFKGSLGPPAMTAPNALRLGHRDGHARIADERHLHDGWKERPSLVLGKPASLVVTLG